MKATAYLYRPGIEDPEIHHLTERPELEWYQAKVGGWIELVPGFNHVRIGERIVRCIVFCDEEGKLKSLPYNGPATIAWNDALPSGLQDSSGAVVDVLVGPVLIIVGDDEFMEAL